MSKKMFMCVLCGRVMTSGEAHDHFTKWRRMKAYESRSLCSGSMFSYTPDFVEDQNKLAKGDVMIARRRAYFRCPFCGTISEITHVIRDAKKKGYRDLGCTRCVSCGGHFIICVGHDADRKPVWDNVPVHLAADIRKIWKDIGIRG